jgi:hypothetical protein
MGFFLLFFGSLRKFASRRARLPTLHSWSNERQRPYMIQYKSKCEKQHSLICWCPF